MERAPVLLGILLMSVHGTTGAPTDATICYILDGILFVYGIILTVLYCRLKIKFSSGNTGDAPKKQEEGIYTGLSSHAADTYETLGTKMKGQV